LHTISLLQDAGADTEAKTLAGTTALEIASKNAHAEVVRLLQERKEERNEEKGMLDFYAGTMHSLAGMNEEESRRLIKSRVNMVADNKIDNETTLEGSRWTRHSVPSCSRISVVITDNPAPSITFTWAISTPDSTFTLSLAKMLRLLLQTQPSAAHRRVLHIFHSHS